MVLNVPESDFYIKMIRQVGRTFLEHHDCNTEDADDLEMIIGELCANVTRHARSKEGYYRVMIEHHGDHITVVVADQGPGFCIEEVAPVGSLRPDKGETMRYGGYGLQLVDSLADQMDIVSSEATGTTVRVRKCLRKAVWQQTQGAPALVSFADAYVIC